MFLLYNFLLTLLSPIWIPWMLIRTWRRKLPVNWKERQGDFEIPPRGDRRRIWFHAVSVGEVVAALPILRELKTRLPKHEVVLSVTTASGHATAKERAGGLYDYLVYFPIDVARFQLRAVQRVRPDAVVIMETELWLNFLWAAKTFDARTLVINGRISDRNWNRSKHLAFFYRVLLRDVDRCLMQSETDRERIGLLGAKEAEILGNCKFDQALEGLDADPKEWQSKLKLTEGRPVVVVGSIRAEEFDFLAQAIALYPMPHWIVAPRHLEKTPALVDVLQRGGRSIGMRSKRETGDVIVLDSYGELSNVYSVADVVVVGGGFADLGGQNIIQPLAHGKPVLFGMHMQNFRDVAPLAIKAQAAFQCASPEDLASQIRELIQSEAARQAMGHAARDLVKRNVGASARYATAIADEVRKL